MVSGGLVTLCSGRLATLVSSGLRQTDTQRHTERHTERDRELENFNTEGERDRERERESSRTQKLYFTRIVV